MFYGQTWSLEDSADKNKAEKRDKYNLSHVFFITI